MSGSPIISAVLQHRARIPYHFSDSPALCPDRLSFQRLFGIVPESPFIFSDYPALCPDPLSFQWLSSIAPESPFLFSGSRASCPDPFFFSVAFRHGVQILYHFNCSPAMPSNPLFFSTILRHRVRIPYRFDGSPASCSDPFSFRRLSSIVSGSPIIQRLFGIVPISPFFLVALWHRVRILFLFDGSPASCPDSLVIFLIYDLESFIFHLVLKLTT